MAARGDEIGEVISRVASHLGVAAEQVTLTELVEEGPKLGLDSDAVERAASALEARQSAGRARDEARLTAKRTRLRWGAGVSVLAALVLLAFALSARAELVRAEAEAKSAKSEADHAAAVSRYNARAATLLGRFWTTLSSLPRELPANRAEASW